LRDCARRATGSHRGKARQDDGNSPPSSSPIFWNQPGTGNALTTNYRPCRGPLPEALACSVWASLSRRQGAAVSTWCPCGPGGSVRSRASVDWPADPADQECRSDPWRYSLHGHPFDSNKPIERYRCRTAHGAHRTTSVRVSGGSPLCGPAFPQVDPDRQGEVRRSDAGPSE